jgi:hypothetical protein
VRQSSYTDEEGRHWSVSLPDGVPETDAALGIPLGPISLEPLGLPLEVEVRLHNQLFARRIFTVSDVKARRVDIFGALQAAFRVDTERIAQLYLAQESTTKPAEPKRTKQTQAPKRGQRTRRRR